jgi:hypothetical protein
MTSLRHLLLFALVIAACTKPDANTPRVSKEPISVRGWIADVEGPRAAFQTPETEAARKLQIFQAVTVWVDNAPYVSGGVAENGSFILLDVPPGNTTITFTAPGAPAARLVLENIPGHADVLVPAMLLKADSVAFLEPKNVQVRLAAKISKPAPTGRIAHVGGLAVPVINTPIAAMSDRHEYPTPPGGPSPLATVK